MPELETPNPPTPPPEPAKEPAPVADDLTAIDLKDEAKVRGLIAELGRVREQVRDLKPKAEKYDEASGWYTTNKPVVDFLAKHPDIMERREPAKEPVAPADPRLAAFAQKFDLYTTDGKPDVGRAADLIGMIKDEARAVAREEVGPVAATTHQDRTKLNFQRALQVAAPDGRRANPETLATMFRGMPVELTADEGVAAALAYAAIGHDVVHNKPAPKAPEQEPLVTEGLGGGRRRTAALTPFDERIANLRGQKTDTYQKLTEGFVKGQINQLED